MLRLEQLTCGYGAFSAVHALDLEIDNGAVHALIGANGAGKSSTLMAIAGHVTVQSGRILYREHDVGVLPVAQRVRRGIAVAPEGRRLFSDLSVDENLAVGGYAFDKAENREARERVLSLFPRLAERLSQAAGSLSGGEQQMLAIGRALMANPSLLLIDELSLGLMPKAIDACYAALKTLNAEGMTILLVEQSTERALAIAGRVTVLESGRAVWDGTAAEARADTTLVDAYLGLT